ncbi:MAG: hypothetical protein ACAI25_17275, partial [Planctomycetota bacterium]
MNPLLLALLAQVIAGSEVLHHGWSLDLDSQTISAREEGDVRFLLDGDKGTIVAGSGAKLGTLTGELDELASWDGELDKKQKRLKLDRGATVLLGVKTDKGKLALLRVTLPTLEDAHFVAVSYRYQRDGSGEFPLPPDPPLLEEGEKGLLLRWSVEEGAEHGVFTRDDK